MNNRDAQNEKLEDRLRRWGANTHARETSPRSLRPIGTPARWPRWVWGAPIAVAASLAVLIGVAMMFDFGPTKIAHQRAAATRRTIEPLVVDAGTSEPDRTVTLTQYEEAVAMQDALTVELGAAREEITDLHERGESLEYANAEMMAELAEQASAHEDQVASLTTEVEDATATAEAMAELIRWNPTSIVDCQAFIRDRQLLARGNAIIAASPDSHLGQFAAVCQSYTMRASLLEDDPDAVARVVEMMERTNVVSRLEQAMTTYADDAEVFLWLAETHALLSEVTELA
jgi:hypothetical protein